MKRATTVLVTRKWTVRKFGWHDLRACGQTVTVTPKGRKALEQAKKEATR